MPVRTLWPVYYMEQHTTKDKFTWNQKSLLHHYFLMFIKNSQISVYVRNQPLLQACHLAHLCLANRHCMRWIIPLIIFFNSSSFILLISNPFFRHIPQIFLKQTCGTPNFFKSLTPYIQTPFPSFDLMEHPFPYKIHSNTTYKNSSWNIPHTASIYYFSYPAHLTLCSTLSTTFLVGSSAR